MGFSIAKHGSAFVANAPTDPALRLRVAKPAEARAEFERLFASVVTARPGRYLRNEHFWMLAGRRGVRPARGRGAPLGDRRG